MLCTLNNDTEYKHHMSIYFLKGGRKITLHNHASDYNSSQTITPLAKREREKQITLNLANYRRFDDCKTQQCERKVAQW